jgi:hypothetical protein
MDKVKHFGVRWDENEDALTLEDKINHLPVYKRSDALLKLLLSDHFNGHGNLLRAAAAIAIYKIKSPSRELLEAAVQNYRFLAKNRAWIESYGDDAQALKICLDRESDMAVKQLSALNPITFASAALTAIANAVHRAKRVTKLPVHARHVRYRKLSEFAEVSFEALKGVIDGDKDLQDAKLAVEKAMVDADRSVALSQEQITNLYVPFVKLVAQRYYKEAGSGHHEWSEIFDATTVNQIATQFAVDYIASRQ